jgi:hypothetical protein
MAGLFTVLNGRRVRRLALACPAGLRVAEHPTADMFTIRAEQVPSYIVSSPEALVRIPSTDLTVDMKVGRYRELTSLARIIWDKEYDPKLSRWLKWIRVADSDPVGDQGSHHTSRTSKGLWGQFACKVRDVSPRPLRMPLSPRAGHAPIRFCRKFVSADSPRDLWPRTIE